jgi:hypothetical protein
MHAQEGAGALKNELVVSMSTWPRTHRNVLFCALCCALILILLYQESSIWNPKRRVAYIHVGEPSELGSL